ncbi:hypothetical protein BC832DRAFT_558313 [Gaertneriomyces semiglobifer]|nr:hypothetical protein BC832DRAFT_558313 [Gaertneriomyces semiglobifer]
MWCVSGNHDIQSGEDCAINNDCETGTICEGAALDAPGTCIPPPTIAQTCTVTCDTDLICELKDGGPAKWCISSVNNVPEGADCAIDEDCSGSATCVNAVLEAPGTCTPLPTIAQTCTDTCDTGLTCEVKDGGVEKWCVSSTNDVAEGGACAIDTDCDGSATCVNADIDVPGTCTAADPLPTIAQTCTDTCDTGLTCEVKDGGVEKWCVSTTSDIAEGGACAIDTDCDGSATCVNADIDVPGTCTAADPLPTIAQTCTDTCDTGLTCEVKDGGVEKWCVSTTSDIAEGGACAIDTDCDGSATCVNADIDSPGACTLAAGGDGLTALGDTCDDDTDCLATLKCATKAGADKVCVHREPVAAGQNCVIQADCINYGACNIVGSAKTGVCVATGGHGQACGGANGQTCTPNTLQCTNNLCVLKTPASTGQTCAIDGDCVEGTCVKTGSALTGQCTAPAVLRTIGQSCKVAENINCASGLTCTGSPSVCVRETPKTVKIYGACAITADCVDAAGYCERANATAGAPGRCVDVRSLGVECANADQCATGSCENSVCALTSSRVLLAEPITVPPVPVVANQAATVGLPGGVDLTLTSLAGGNVEVTAAGTPPTGIPQPPGKGVALFLSIDAPEGGLSDARLDFEYLAALQAETGVAGDELTWYTFDEETKEWVACAAEDTEWDTDTRILTCRTEHFSDWTISTKASAAFAAFAPHLLTLLGATLLSVTLVF